MVSEQSELGLLLRLCPDQPHYKLPRNLSLCRLRGDLSGFENSILCASSMSLDHDRKKEEVSVESGDGGK